MQSHNEGTHISSPVLFLSKKCLHFTDSLQNGLNSSDKCFCFQSHCKHILLPIWSLDLDKDYSSNNSVFVCVCVCLFSHVTTTRKSVVRSITSSPCDLCAL